MCTLVLKCSFEYMLSWSHACMFTCFVDNLLTFVFALMIKCSHVYLLWWSHALTCFDVHMLLCSHTLIFTHFDDRVLPCLHTLMITCPLTCMPLFSYAWMLWWLLAYMFKCFDDCMLTCTDIHKFDIHTHVHTWWSCNRLGGKSDCIIGCMCA